MDNRLLRWKFNREFILEFRNRFQCYPDGAERTRQLAPCPANPLVGRWNRSFIQRSRCTSEDLRDRNSARLPLAHVSGIAQPIHLNSVNHQELQRLETFFHNSRIFSEKFKVPKLGKTKRIPSNSFAILKQSDPSHS